MLMRIQITCGSCQNADSGSGPGKGPKIFCISRRHSDGTDAAGPRATPGLTRPQSTVVICMVKTGQLTHLESGSQGRGKRTVKSRKFPLTKQCKNNTHTFCSHSEVKDLVRWPCLASRGCQSAGRILLTTTTTKMWNRRKKHCCHRKKENGYWGTVSSLQHKNKGGGSL